MVLYSSLCKLLNISYVLRMSCVGNSRSRYCIVTKLISKKFLRSRAPEIELDIPKAR